MIFAYDHELIVFLAQTLETPAMVAYPSGSAEHAVFVIGPDALEEAGLYLEDDYDIWRALPHDGGVLLYDPNGDIHKTTTREETDNG